MSLLQQYTSTLSVFTCCNKDCGVKFGLDSEYEERRREDHEWFYCPNGHAQHFSGKSEKERLKDKVADLEREQMLLLNKRDELYNRIEQLNYSVRAQKAAKTKILNRVKNGVCPCCNRSFQNLQNHFKTVHPELLETK